MGLSKFRNMTKDKIKRFSLKGYEVEAKVLKIHDGDTCDLAFEFERKIRRFKCRLAGINATELDEEDEYDRDGKIARDFLAWLCIGNKPGEFPDEADAWTDEELQGELDKNKKLVYAVFEGFDKYGRLLVWIRSSKSSRKKFNMLLVENKFAEESD